MKSRDEIGAAAFDFPSSPAVSVTRRVVASPSFLLSRSLLRCTKPDMDD